MNEQKIINGLNYLLAKNYDTEQGYKTAAEKTDNQILAAFYRGKASNRFGYGHQIKDILREMEADIEKGTTLEGKTRNAWVNFRTLFSYEKEEAILELIEDSEESCLEEYDEFLNETVLPDSIRNIMTSQRNNIARSLKRVDELEEKYT